MVLAATLARLTASELMPVTVYPDLPAPVLWRTGPGRTESEALLRKLNAFMAPGAHAVVEADWSVPHALARVVSREHPDLLVVGSSRHAPRGRVRIGRYTRQLLGEAKCSLAVAPRGLCSEGQMRLAVIGVGFDGTPEAEQAVRHAGSLARVARAAPGARGGRRPAPVCRMDAGTPLRPGDVGRGHRPRGRVAAHSRAPGGVSDRR